MAQTPEESTEARMRALAEAKRAEAAELRKGSQALGTVGRSIKSLARAVGGQLEAEAQSDGSNGKLVTRFRELEAMLANDTGVTEAEKLGAVLAVLMVEAAH